MKTSSAPVYLRTIKEMNDLTGAGQSWNLDGLRIFIKKPDPDNTHFTQPFRTDSYWVLLVMENSITIQLNGEEHIAKENDLLIIPPHVIRQAKGMEDDCKAACVAFTPEFLLGTGLSQRYIDLFDFLFNSGGMHIQMAAEDASRFMTVITMLREKNFSENDHPFTAEVVRHFFNVFQFELAGLYHKYSNQKKTIHDHKEELLWRFLALLSKHVKTERGLQFYANRLFVTAKYLTQTVKKLSGRTAGEYIDELVIVEAKNLLRDPSLTIAQVADRLYFGDQFIFSKFFKRSTGITPSDYRKSA